MQYRLRRSLRPALCAILTWLAIAFGGYRLGAVA